MKKRFMPFITSVFIITVIPYVGSCDDMNLRKDINEFVYLLSKDIRPTLSDYYKFYGEGSEDELQFEIFECTKKGWTPSEKNINCINYIRERKANSNSEESYYLSWLKTKLPASPKLHIHNVRQVDGENFKYQIISASLNSIEVTFFRPLDSDKKIEFGLISVSSIKGIPVSKLFEEEFGPR
jgi:hypothetical protein